ncbi:MAG: chorismate synthase [Lachnospiraceae bacterium]|nr:chorismate synthase [Lachnospiraceae bacterium]
MAGSVFGTLLTVSTFGESHGAALGAVIDGFPAGMELSAEDIQPYLERRRPGRSAASTERNEPDRVEILSGVFGGRTTGAPIAMVIRSTAQRSGDYADLAECYRPGHADYGYDAKYGIRDYRGGGRSSGRETVSRVAAGAVAAKLLKSCGIEVFAWVTGIGEERLNSDQMERIRNALISGEGAEHYLRLRDSLPTGIPDEETSRRALELIGRMREEGDSVGSSIECIITGVPAGIGDPVFNKLDAKLAGAVMSVGAVKSVSFGDGLSAMTARGSEFNDPFTVREGTVIPETNRAGGILGGISTGREIILDLSVKPTPSIFRPQKTVSSRGEETTLTIRGRHDPVIAPRAAVVAECMCALSLADSMMINMTSRAEYFTKFYG